MSSKENQHYEVQIHINGRWQLHARYPYHERAVAVREAKELNNDGSIKTPIRVIMDDYNPDTGRHDEVLIYRNKIDSTLSIKPKKKWADMSVSSSGRVGYLSEDVDDFLDSFNEEEKPKAKVSAGMFLAICTMIIIIGAASGIVATGGLALLIKGFSLALSEDIRKILLVGMFIIVSLLGSSSSLNYYRARFDLNIFKGREKKSPPPVKKSEISEQMEKAAEAIDKMPVADVGVDVNATDGDEPFSIYDQVEIEEDPETSTEVSDAFSEEAQQQKMFLINYMGTALSALKGPEASIKTLNRFGLNLFMTGAVVRICQEHELSDIEQLVILKRILEMLGAQSEQATRFSTEYEKYLEEPRHKSLYDASGDIVFKFSEGDQAAPLHIHGIMEEWLNWKPEAEENINPNLLTIMFTDMVGSTDLTTKHGDYAAQEVLKSHDLIVRTALTNFEGKEIKHLGDGIMASFKNYDLALQAASEIQKRVEGNNNAGPEFQLHVRIGLNAGEPIKKDNDLFGTAVQLAARLCDNAASDCITVSQDLVDLCGDKPVYTFIDLGPQQLKGFDTPLPVYQLDWKAPPIEYPEEEEPESSDEKITEESTAPDMAVAAPVKEEIDPNFDAGLSFEKAEEQPASEENTP